MDQLSIREILDSVYRGQIRIPAFQRGFVWEPERVAFFIDSLFKGYPFGALLFWRTNEQLRTEKNLGPFVLPDPDADFPIDYVLDGQQRITSIFGVFQTELKSVNLDGWKDIYFDFSLENNVQETQFFALENDQVEKNRHFPLRAIFNTTEYRKLTRGFDDILANKIDQMQAVFKEAKIPYQSFRTEEKEKVAIIFERINRQGVPLDTLQLLSAWTWSEEFELQAQFDDLIEEIQNYGFSDLGGDISLLLRCSAAILNKSPRPESLVSLNGSEVRKRFNEVINGIKGALDFLKSELNIEAIDNLPYQACLVPLSVFFAVEGNKEFHYNNQQRDILLTWLWKSFFSKRYSAGLLRNLTTDIHEIINLKNSQSSKLSSLSVSITDDFYTKNNFLISSVNTKTFILQLSQNKPVSIISGTPIDLKEKLRQCNRKEFHHLMPKAFLKDSNQVDLYSENCLANFCFISRTDNRKLGGGSPGVYKNEILGDIDNILKSHICPNVLFDDEYKFFIEKRAKLLVENAKKLCNI